MDIDMNLVKAGKITLKKNWKAHQIQRRISKRLVQRKYQIMLSNDIYNVPLGDKVEVGLYSSTSD